MKMCLTRRTVAAACYEADSESVSWRRQIHSSAAEEESTNGSKTVAEQEGTIQFSNS